MSIEKTRPPHGGHVDRSAATLMRSMHDAVAKDVSPQERLDLLTTVIASHVVADVCSIYLRRPDNILELYSSEGLKPEAVHETRLGWGEGLVGVVAATHNPLITAEAPLHPAFAYRPETGEDPLHSFLGVPLLRSGRVLGVLVIQNRAPRRYQEEEIEAVQAVAALLAEVAASGELLDKEETEVLDEMLHASAKLQGSGLAPGIAIGRAAFHEAPTPKHLVFADNVAAEAERLESGLDDLRASVDKMLARNAGLEEVSREVLEAYRLFAYDRGWKDRLRTAVFSGLTAEAAVEQIRNENRARMMQARDPYLRERLHDLDDLAHRFMRILAGDEGGPADLFDETILFARSMGPAELLEYDRRKIKGVVLEEGSETSHVAIVARALEIPIVAGLADVLERVELGDGVVIDGDAGRVNIRPGDEIIESYRAKQELQSERQAAYRQEKDLPSITRDGVEVDLMINAGLAIDLPYLETTGASGVGLFRTELQFLIGAQLPNVATQEVLYRDVLSKAGGKPIIFRTADLGGDKVAAYMQRNPEKNPAMGWRGIRMAIDRPGFFRPQIRALLGASAGQALNILIPMVTLPSELDEARALIEREMKWRRRRGKDMPREVLIGAMIETPAAVWRLDAIAARADFLSVGGNDLAQFYFAADRESEWVQRRFDAINPGYLSFVKSIVDHAAAANTPLTYCGEQASNRLMAAALIGVGVRRFSIAAISVGAFRRMVRSLDVAAISAWLNERLEVVDDSLRDELAAYLTSQKVVQD